MRNYSILSCYHIVTQFVHFITPPPTKPDFHSGGPLNAKYETVRFLEPENTLLPRMRLVL